MILCELLTPVYHHLNLAPTWANINIFTRSPPPPPLDEQNPKWRKCKTHIARALEAPFFSRLGVSLPALNLNKTLHASRLVPLISHSANRVWLYQRNSQLFSMGADIMCTKNTLIDPPAPLALEMYELGAGFFRRLCAFDILIDVVWKYLFTLP